MAKIGLNNFRYGKLIEKPDGTFYYTGSKSPGKAISCNVSVTNNSAKLYADDMLAENDTSFQSATVSIGIDEQDSATYAELLGHTIENGDEVISKVDDQSPYVGLGRIVTMMKNGQTYYKAVLLYKVKFSEPSSESNTKGESVEFGTYTLEGNVYPLPNGAWRKEKKFDSKVDAVTYLEEQLSPQALKTYDGEALRTNDGEIVYTVR